MYRLTQLILSIFVLLLLAQCANQRAPTGGEKDEEPPVLVSSDPHAEQLNFKGKTIQLTFDEAIQLQNAKEQIIITPRIKGEYEIKYRKEKVIIELEEPLKDSTTYTFNFREAIQDLNEGNPADNLKLAFSTGSLLDSLQINGTVKNILTNKALENITVSLYEVADTLNPLEDPPIYFTKTDKTGYYQFDNLKAGNYSLVAINDKNKNLFIDPKSEPYGFIVDTLHLWQNIDSLSVFTQHLDIRPLTFQGARQSGTTFDLKFNKYLTEYSLVTADSTVLHSNFSNDTHNTIQIFNTSFDQDSVRTFIMAYDSVYNQTLDTVYVKFEPTNRSPSAFTSTLTLETVTTSDGLLHGELKFSKPIAQVNYDSAYIFIDSLHVLPLDTSNLTFNKRRDHAQLTYQFDPSFFETPQTSKDTSSISMPKESLRDSTHSKPAKPQKPATPTVHFAQYSFISIEGDSSKVIKKDLNFKKDTDFAILHVEVKPSGNQQFIVQLLTKNYEVVQEVANQQQFIFKHIKPGDYRLRTLVDTNRNGRWDTGNFLKGQSPEPVIFFVNSENQEVLTFRANWEVGPYVINF